MCLVDRGERGKWWDLAVFSPDLPKLNHSNLEWKYRWKYLAIFWTKLSRLGQRSKLFNCPFPLSFFCHSVSFFICVVAWSLLWSFFSFVLIYAFFFFFFPSVLILSSVFYLFFSFFFDIIFSFLLSCAKCFFSQTVSLVFLIKKFWVLLLLNFLFFFNVWMKYNSWTNF